MNKLCLGVVATCLFALAPLWAWAGSYDSFFRAIVRDDPDAIRAWVAQGFDPNARDPNGQPAIIRALLADSNAAALALARLPGLDANTRNASGETPLMMAALKGQRDVCEALIAGGAELSPESGWTPLHYAAAGNSLIVAKLLLAKIVPVDPRAPNGRTPLMMAAHTASEELIELLLRAGADPALRDRRGATAGDVARAQGRERLGKLLEELSFKVPSAPS